MASLENVDQCDMSEPPRLRVMSKADAEAFAAYVEGLPDIWSELLTREQEVESFNLSGRDPDSCILTRPTLIEILEMLLEQRFGADLSYYIGTPVLAVRKELRLELGYSLS